MRIDTNNMAGIGASGLDRTQSADAVEQQAGQAVAKRGAGGATDQVNLCFGGAAAIDGAAVS